MSKLSTWRHVSGLLTNRGIVLLTSFVILISKSESMAAADKVGIILTDIKGCTFINDGDTYPCLKGAFLSPGDIIIAKERGNKLPIQWLIEDAVSFEKIKPVGEKIIFQASIPQNRTVLDGVFKFFRARSTVSRVGSSRNVFVPGPATLLSDRMLKLRWCSDNGENLIISDANGEIFRSNVQGKDSITIDPAELNMQRDKQYKWGVSGMNGFVPKPLWLLTEQREQEVIKGLALASEGETTSRGSLQKAMYLAYLAEIDPVGINFNWLIFDELSERIGEMDEDDRKIATHLLQLSGYENCR